MKPIGKEVGHIPSYIPGKPATNHYDKDPGIILLNGQVFRLLRMMPGVLLTRLREKDGK